MHEAFVKEGITYHNISTSSTFGNALKMTRRYLRTMKEEQNQENKETAEENNKQEADK